MRTLADPRVAIAGIWGILISLALVGCAGHIPNKPPEVPHALWDPGYWEDALADAVLDVEPPWWPESTCHGLLHRSSFDDYWRLVRAVMEKAGQADTLVILEKLPGEGTYWFALLVQRGGELLCYTNGVPPLPGGFPQYSAKPVEAPYAVWGRTTAAQDMQQLCQLMDEVDVWDQYPRVFPCNAVHPAAWLIHLYRRPKNKHVSFVIEWPSLNTDVIFGQVGLMKTPRSGIPLDDSTLYPDALSVWGRMSEKKRAEWTKRYKESYHVRAVLNGTLRILCEVYPRELSAQQREAS